MPKSHDARNLEVLKEVMKAQEGMMEGNLSRPQA